ncbi:MAG: PEP-CTERM sorting domain-containing protein [Pirellulales bacterium]|nr:PEP-CTERM sorting domain-containing protein [Pirellulales bacterium]
MRSWIVLSAAALLCVFALSAQAEPLATSLLYLDGQTITQLEDNDWESFLDGNANWVVEQGEYFYGMFDITDVRDASPQLQPDRQRQANMFAGVFVAEVKSVTPSALFTGGATVQLQPAPAAVWTQLGLAAPVSANTIAVVYSDPDGPQGMVDPNAPGANPLARVIASLATATNGTKIWEVGFAGGGADPTEFWTGEVNNANMLALQVLLYNASLNVTALGPGAAGVTLLDHDFLFGPNILSEVQLSGRMESLSAGNFMIRTDTDFYLKAIPEPSTIGLLLAGLACLVGARRLRRG